MWHFFFRNLVGHVSIFCRLPISIVPHIPCTPPYLCIPTICMYATPILITLHDPSTWLHACHLPMVVPTIPTFCTCSPQPFHIHFLFLLAHVCFGRNCLVCDSFSLDSFLFLSKNSGKGLGNGLTTTTATTTTSIVCYIYIQTYTSLKENLPPPPSKHYSDS